MTRINSVCLMLGLSVVLSSINPATSFTTSNGFQRTTVTKSPTQLHAFEVATTTFQAMGAATGVASQASSAAMSTVNTFFESQPYLAAFLTCSFKASAADMVAQSQEDKTEETVVVDEGVDVARNLGFLLYGGLYQGMAQNYLYNVIYPAWLGTDDSWTLILKEVVVDNLIFAPLLCLPIAYMFKTAFTTDDNITLETFQQGLEKYVDDVRTKGLLSKYWTIWIPAQFLTFGVVPPHFRVAFVAAISFFWIFLLSTIASSTEESATPQMKLQSD